MKELSIEEKAKRYNEALAKAAKIHRNYKGRVRAVDVVIEEVFPELKESKDEKIKKVIYGWIYTQPSQFFDSGFSKEEILAWLEKQNEQKPVIEMKTPEESLGIDSNTYNKIVDECIYGEQKPANKAEPKFRIGDNIEPIDSCLGSSRTIYKICDGWYETNQGTLNFEFEKNWRLIEQKPVAKYKVGDTICYNSFGRLVSFTIVNVVEDGTDNPMYEDKDGNSVFQSDIVEQNSTEDSCKNSDDITTEEKDMTEYKKGFECGKQRVLKYPEDFDLCKKTLTAWSEEDELIIKRIDSLLYSINESEFEDIHAWLKSLKDRVQPQQEWSKEDEGYYDAIIAKLEVTREDALLTDNEMDFLKSLEKRVFPKSTWNEEDEKVIHCLEYTIRHFYVDEDTIEWCCDWLKSLRPQNRWKPSEEQITWLYRAADVSDKDSRMKQVLNELLSDLKKLI